MKTTTKIIIGIILGAWILTFIGFGIKVDNQSTNNDDIISIIEQNNNSTLITLKENNTKTIIFDCENPDRSISNKIVIARAIEPSHISLPDVLKDYYQISQSNDTLLLHTASLHDLDYNIRDALNNKTIYINLNNEQTVSINNNANVSISLYNLSLKNLTITQRYSYIKTHLNKCDIKHLTLNGATADIFDSNIKNYSFPQKDHWTLFAKDLK